MLTLGERNYLISLLLCFFWIFSLLFKTKCYISFVPCPLVQFIFSVHVVVWSRVCSETILGYQTVTGTTLQIELLQKFHQCQE